MTELKLLSDKVLYQLLTRDKVVTGVLQDMENLPAGRGTILDDLRAINQQQKQGRQYLAGLNSRKRENVK